jgi:hypothetical protein
MEKFIRVNGVEVEELSCVVNFRLTCDLGNMETFTVTHSRMYELLETATKVETEGLPGKCFVKFNQGSVTFWAYDKRKDEK